MGISSLIQEAGVSLENIDPVPLVEETVVSPVIQPSAAVPVAADAVVSTEEPVVPVVTADQLPPPSPEPVVTPAPVDPVAPVVPVAVAEAAIIETEIATAQAEGAQFEVEQAAIQAKAEELLEIQTSLESLQTIIRKTGANGISNQTAQVVQLQLQAINRKLGLESQFVSVENFTARDNREQFGQAKVALEDIRTSVKVGKNKFFEVIERMIAAFKKIVMSYLDGVNSLEKKVDALDTRLKGIKTSAGEGSTISVNNAAVIMYQDSADIPGDIAGLAHFAAVAYPEAVVKYLDQSAKTILKFNPDDWDIDRLTEEFTRYARPLKFLVQQKADEEELPGGYYLDIDDDQMSVGIKGEGNKSEVTEIPVLSIGELRKKVREIKEIVVQIREIRPEVDKIDKASNRLMEAGKRVYSKKGDSEGPEHEAVLFSAAVRAYSAKPRIDEIIKYLVRYLNAQVAVSEKMADAIEKPVAED